MSAAAPRGDRDQNADQSKDRTAGADRGGGAELGAEKRAEESTNGIEEKIARASINFFDHRPDVQKDHHIEADVKKTAMKVVGRDQAVPAEIGIAKRDSHAQPIKGFAVHAEKNAEALTLPSREAHQKRSREHDDVRNKNCCRSGSLPAEEPRKAFTHRCERKSQVCAAFVAASGVDANKRVARRTKFWARLIVTAATAKKSARGISPTIEPLLPLIGNTQSASLRAAKGIPIIPELVRELRSRSVGVRKTLWISLKR